MKTKSQHNLWLQTTLVLGNEQAYDLALFLSTERSGNVWVVKHCLLATEHADASGLNAVRSLIKAHNITAEMEDRIGAFAYDYDVIDDVFRYFDNSDSHIITTWLDAIISEICNDRPLSTAITRLVRSFPEYTKFFVNNGSGYVWSTTRNK